ncbi:MAG: integrase core domain-containing protein [Candidatus Saccharimonadales bacterium]
MRVNPKDIIKQLKINEDRVRQTARDLGVSPGTVINWRRRAGTGRLAHAYRYSTKGLERRSTRPKTVRSTSLTSDQQKDLLALRKTTHYGADKLATIVRTGKSAKTVHRFLKSRGLTAPGKNYRRPRYQETTHMYLKNATAPGKLQMDVKYVTPELSGLVHTTYLYAVIDIWSRWKQGIILPKVDQALAIEALQYIVPLLPFKPDFIQTDNGLEYQERFRRYVTKDLGWQHHYIHKSSPNENAVIERSFRTDEEEFFWWLEAAPEDLVVLNTRYQEYLDKYNTYRPHLGIDLQTPQEKLRSYQSVQ